MLEFSVAAESIQAIINLLVVALGLSVLVCLRFVGPLLRRRLPLGRRSEVLCQMLLAGLTSLQILAWHLYFYRRSHDAIELGYVLGAVAAGLCLWHVLTGPQGWLHRRWGRCLPAALACLALAQLAGIAAVTQCFAEFKPSPPLEAIAPPGDLVISDRASARTDRGSVVNLYERTGSLEEFQSFLSSARKSVTAVAERAMRRDEPRFSSNCHGWVFTAGQFIVRSRDVQTILDENGYFEVRAPRLNDLVIYRNGTGEIIHTGIVRGFLNGDLALVESKWGAEATYLHLADEQPYSQNISYWHTDRGSHLLETVQAE
jgi:hypothetical protein